MSMPYNCPMKRVKLFENLLGKCGWNNQQTIEFHPSPSLIQSHHIFIMKSSSSYVHEIK